MRLTGSLLAWQLFSPLLVSALFRKPLTFSRTQSSSFSAQRSLSAIAMDFADLEIPTPIRNYLQEMEALPPKKQRAVAAMIGAAVADAATRPFHWVYNRTQLEGVVGDEEHVEFWPQSISPFYTLPTGRRSCYNDLSLAMLRAVASVSDVFDETRFVSAMQQMFASNSEYDLAMKRRKEAYDPAKRLEDRQPIEGPWQQGAVTAFMKDLEDFPTQRPKGNPASKETDGLCCSLPVICRLSCKESSEALTADSLHTVFRSASLLSSNLSAVAHTLSSASILHSLICAGGEGIDADKFTSNIQAIQQTLQSGSAEYPMLSEIDVREVLIEFEDVKAALKQNYVDTVERFGKACANPGSFMGASLAILQSKHANHNAFADAIRKVIRSGGCNCSKANFVGACLGAAYGVQKQMKGGDNGIPLSWIVRTADIEEIIELALRAVKDL